jgi:RNA-directed DNA polymerase
MQQNIQDKLNFSVTPAGETREAGREETESRLTTRAPERPAGTTRLMEEICDRENLGE